MPLQIQIIDGMVGNNPIFLSSPAGVPYQYSNGAHAAAIVEEHRRAYIDSIPPKRFRIVKMEDTPAESDLANKQWRSRELGRFQSGYYDRVPWCDESWYRESEYISLHHCHMSRDKSAMVAFTESDEKGRDDKQKRMRAGRYLTQYFSESGAIDEIEIRYWAGKLSILAGGESDQLLFAKTPDEIEQVYIDGPRSCMAYDADHYQGSCHPVRIYGAGDFAVAYVERESSIAARVLAYPANKVYSTVYGDGGVWSQQLKDLLDSAGYRFSSDHPDWKGARLLRVECDQGFVVPYFDIPGRATDDGEYLRVDRFGDIGCDNEHGVSEDENLSTCENCSERHNSEDSGGMICDSYYCDSCYGELSFSCEDCEETGFTEDSCYIDGSNTYVCDSCAENYPTCDQCGERNNLDSSIHVESMDKTYCESCFSDHCMTCGQCSESDKSDSFVESIDGEPICKSCAESKVQCIECDKYDESDNCFVDSDGDSWCGDCRQEPLDLEPEKESGK